MTDSGDRFIVEMQRWSQKDFIERAVLYMSFPTMLSVPKGADTYEISGVYFVGILNFKVDYGDKYNIAEDNYLFDYVIHERTYDIEVPNWEMKFIELPRFNKGIDEIEGILEKWLYALCNMNKLLERPTKLQERVFQMLFAAADLSAYEESDVKIYRKTAMKELDFQRSQLWEKEKSQKKGEAIGHKKGKIEGKIEFAANLLTLGVDEEIILKASGFSREELEELKNKKQ